MAGRVKTTNKSLPSCSCCCPQLATLPCTQCAVSWVRSTRMVQTVFRHLLHPRKVPTMLSCIRWCYNVFLSVWLIPNFVQCIRALRLFIHQFFRNVIIRHWVDYAHLIHIRVRFICALVCTSLARSENNALVCIAFDSWLFFRLPSIFFQGVRHL